MDWKGSCPLIIEACSIEVFCWARDKGLRPWSLFSIFKEIDLRVSCIENVSFSKVNKHGNVMASALAVAGLKRQGMFKAWWGVFEQVFICRLSVLLAGTC
ncbi:hypothetical protein CXB51_025181 [Gossypium anomalum]|uniref:RNase H type-1 domain-containing protein n=1 Tax=Gossypium anomalum TaxID=47600 RepID=A0A8J5Y2A2_9ROSI|nr:hypothetical protein CXB51_025181 [Gossypium anomalum]